MKKYLIILLVLISISVQAKIVINRDSIIQIHVKSFMEELSNRNINIDSNITISFQVKNIRSLGSYGQCISKNNSNHIIIRFDDMKFDQYVSSNNPRKIKYFIFHELAHALIKKQDCLSNNRDIMNAKIFNNSVTNPFDYKYETIMLNALFKVEILRN